MKMLRFPAKAARPSVGPFWGVPHCNGRFHILAVTTELAVAELYGECLTEPRGHAELWQEWLKLSPRELKARSIPIGIKEHPYEYWPRGRVVYEVPNMCFVIYADLKLHHHRIMTRIMTTFALTGLLSRVSSDEHYRSDADLKSYFPRVQK